MFLKINFKILADFFFQKEAGYVTFKQAAFN